MSDSSDSARTAGSGGENVTMRRPRKMRVSTVRDDTSSDRRKFSLKVPKFSPEDPELWFALLESQFDSLEIIEDSVKFSSVASNLDIQYAKTVKDIILNPPATNRYEKIKAELLRRLSASHEMKVKQLLTQERLGDRKPSQFLRHLQDLAGSSAAEDIVKQIWSNQLPIAIQTVLASQPSHSLEQLADLADRIQELTAPPAVAMTSAVAQVNGNSSNEIAELRKMVERLAMKIDEQSRPSRRPHDRSRPRRRQSPARPRSRSNSSYRKYPICWYHFKFGPKAHQCITPCDYGKSGNATGSR